jgi:hypothetical protein
MVNTMAETFEHWLPLRLLRMADLPDCGDCCAVYALRDQRTSEILKLGETNCLRRRIFGNLIGGVGGSTTLRINLQLFDEGIMLDRVEIAWIVTEDKAAARAKEKKFRRDFKAAYGRFPLWDLQA